jgi:FMN phosphatase YigB (HAD superfamily)
MKKKKMVLLDIDYTLFDTKTFKESSLKKYSLYNEVMLVLESLAKIAQLGIFSKGEIELQNVKLQKTGIKNFFNGKNIHIFEDKDLNLKDVLEKYKNFKIFLVDDKLTTLYNAKINTPSIFTVWVKRGPFAENQKPLENFSPDATINDFSSLNRIISRN